MRNVIRRVTYTSLHTQDQPRCKQQLAQQALPSLSLTYVHTPGATIPLGPSSQRLHASVWHQRSTTTPDPPASHGYQDGKRSSVPRPSPLRFPPSDDVAFSVSNSAIFYLPPAPFLPSVRSLSAFRRQRPVPQGPKATPSLASNHGPAPARLATCPCIGCTPRRSGRPIGRRRRWSPHLKP